MLRLEQKQHAVPNQTTNSLTWWPGSHNMVRQWMSSYNMLSQTPTPSEFNLGFYIKIALVMNPTSLSIPAIYCTSYLRKTVTTVKDLFPALLVQFTVHHLHCDVRVKINQTSSVAPKQSTIKSSRSHTEKSMANRTLLHGRNHLASLMSTATHFLV